AQVDRARPYHGDHRPRYGLAVRAGRAHHRAAGGAGGGRRHAEGDPQQRQGPRGLSPGGARPQRLPGGTGPQPHYWDSHILFDVALRVEANEVVALLGRNGAGKSTTLKSLMGIVTPRAGSIRFDGVEIAGRAAHAIAQAGMQLVPEDRRIFGSLSV